MAHSAKPIIIAALLVCIGAINALPPSDTWVENPSPLCAQPGEDIYIDGKQCVPNPKSWKSTMPDPENGMSDRRCTTFCNNVDYVNTSICAGNPCFVHEPPLHPSGPGFDDLLNSTNCKLFDPEPIIFHRIANGNDFGSESSECYQGTASTLSPSAMITSGKGYYTNSHWVDHRPVGDWKFNPSSSPDTMWDDGTLILKSPLLMGECTDACQKFTGYCNWGHKGNFDAPRHRTFGPWKPGESHTCIWADPENSLGESAEQSLTVCALLKKGVSFPLPAEGANPMLSGIQFGSCDKMYLADKSVEYNVIKV